MLYLSSGSSALGTIAWPSQLVVVDSRLPDVATLVAGVKPEAGVLVLDPGRDGIAQVSEAIAQWPQLAAVHLLGHGQAGQMQLGATTLTAAALTDYAPQLEGWRSHLTPEADLLLYGCNVAAEPQPSQLLVGLAALTGADVAASDDLTGRGGDWVLEVATGAIETALPFDLAATSAYAGTLATLQVNTTNDVGEAIDGVISLREAIIAINAGGPGVGDAVNSSADPYGTNDTIVLPAGTYTITLAGPGDNANLGGDFDINKALTLRGAGATSTIIQATPVADRVFHVTANVPLAIDGIQITGGNVFGSGGGIFASGNVSLTNSQVTGNTAGGPNQGGGIYSVGPLTLLNSTVSNNRSINPGGGIYGKDNITLTNSKLVDNLADESGGGIANTTLGKTLTLTNSIVSGNSSTARIGGGIYNTGAVTLTNTTVSNNSSSSAGGGLYSTSPVTVINSTINGNYGTIGGGINSIGDISLTNSTVSNNTAINDGGGIYSKALATLSNSTVSGNSGTTGGGIFSSTGVINNSTLTNNWANNGGGIYTSGSLSFLNSTASKNTATNDGGGIFSSDMTLVNSTISGNQAGRGGGLLSTGGLVVTNSTIAFNQATTAIGGIYQFFAVPIAIRNSIIAKNTSPGVLDLGGSFGGPNTFTNNLMGSTTGLPITLDTTNQANIDPLLGSLANNGGTTLTHLPASGSPAINKGDNAFSPGSTDQTGKARIVGGAIDLGAVEIQAPPPTPLVPDIELRDLTGAIVPLGGATTVNFGSTRVGSPIDQPFQIRNLGDGPLDLTNLTLPNGFVLQSPTLPTTLAPGSLLDLVIRLNAQTPGSFTGLLTLSNNDSDETPYFFTLTGKVGLALPGFQTFTVALARPPFPNPEDRPRRNIPLAPGRLSAVGSNEDETLSTDLAESVIFGLGGDDVLLGSAGGDRLYGNAGRDFGYGRGGNDWLDGGTGDDAIRGNEGDDRLLGGTGNDYLLGDAGNDDLYAGPGANTLDGAAGNDEIFGGPDADAIWGEGGSDRLSGSDGNDTILGEGDDDAILGEAGNDALNGNEGNDGISGGLGDDTILGEAGVDLLDGGTGNDILVGGEGADRFILRRPLAGQAGVQFIADYEPGVDGFLLVDGLTFGELEIATNEFGQPVIQLAATGEILALLQQPVILTSADFAS